MTKRKHPLSEGVDTVGKAQCGDGVVGTGAEGDSVKKGLARCPRNRQLRSRCKQCVGTSISEHNLRRSQEAMRWGASVSTTAEEVSNQYDGGSICEHNSRRNKCKPCGGSCFCEHNCERSICEHNRIRSVPAEGGLVLGRRTEERGHYAVPEMQQICCNRFATE